MANIPQDACLHLLGTQHSASIYQLRSGGFNNRYYIVSGEGTRHLMASPEVVGYESYLAMKPATSVALDYLHGQGLADEVDILTILRGGLNYPLEECCYKAGIRVPNMNFISCERKIESGVITGLDIKYEKLHIARDITLMIGDIVASGDTLRLCLSQVVDRFRRRGGSLKRVIFFTVGGTKAIPLMERFTEDIRRLFPGFEGFYCVFYEGIFTVYEDKGVTGINIPDIDFGWQGGLIAPEFRHYVLSFLEDALFEKCIIYDGGARRYEIPIHYDEVMEYWESLLARAPQVDFPAFIAEKIGYSRPISYEQWRQLNGYGELDVKKLYDLEQHYLDLLSHRTLAEICERRIREIKETLGKYIQ
ncbi:MAG: hypothetical protein K5910_07085 [Bacteroidales bacterium]|nr:hypothetical protein [Bacteroidales bacterium]